MSEATFNFPDDFLWGTATAAYQVEGNNTNSDWWAWEQQSHAILDGHKSGVACDWWENAERDLDMAAELGTNAHRMSLEWSRIEPEPGVYDEAALARYREILSAMHARGLQPMVTLHHFSNPQWLVEKDDFASALTVDYFRRYVEKVVETLGDLIPTWVTINEPMVYIVLRYLEPTFPKPRRRGMSAAMFVFRNLLRCHAAAYHAIKAAYPDAPVGIAKHFRPIRPPSNNSAAKAWASRLNWMFNDMWMEALTTGTLKRPGGSGTIPHLAGTYDFVGVNYYTYSVCTFPPRPNQLYKDVYPADAIVGDGNYGEVYPQGLYDVLLHVWKQYQKPIYITENGMPDDDDDQRPAFILAHLREVWRVINFNIPVMGYYHWSLIDNFEWDRGWTQRFGLIALDTLTQERTLRESGKLYAEICNAGAINAELTKRYAPQALETLFP